MVKVGLTQSHWPLSNTFLLNSNKLYCHSKDSSVRGTKFFAGRSMHNIGLKYIQILKRRFIAT